MMSSARVTPTALEVEHLAVSFGDIRIFDDLSFRVDAGSSLAIIGPNGAGKTVLFKALIGSVRSGGTIRWPSGTRIGYVPQKLDIERDIPLTGLEFLRARAEISGMPATDVERVLGLVALDPQIASQPLGTLSGGQFQRLLVAFALMGRPTVLLFDEPTAGVDEPGEEEIYALFHRLQREEGLTLLIISHELSLVYRYADNVLCLSRRHISFGPPLEILTPERLQEVYGAPARYHRHDAPGA
ncbi:MAG: metal ABC transporter ATP-binding protein [Gemmatimonadaceae bacterium]|nr:metal ABC transporter ATP-binding protein [Gemmatimonadaceae bacterium]